MKREQGFTAIELLVTLVILTILLALAVPGFSDWRQRYQLRGAARDIYSNLQLAKMNAVKDRAVCGVLFDAASNRYRVVGSGTNRTFESGGGDDVVLKTVNLSEYGRGLGFGHGSASASVDAGGFDNNVTFPNDGIVFDPRGMILSPAGASCTGGYVYVQNTKNNAFGVGVMSGGGIVLRRWTGSAWQ